MFRTNQFPSTGASMGADDDDQAARVRAARERGGDGAEDAGEADRERLPAGLVEDGGAPVVEPVRAGHAAEPVAERADPARDLSRPVDVARAVQDVDPHPPRRPESGAVARGAAAVAARGREGDRRGEARDRDGPGGEEREPAGAAAAAVP